MNQLSIVVVLFLSTILCFAQNNLSHDLKYGFDLPNRPIGSQRVYDFLVKGGHEFDAKTMQEEDMQRCPKISTLIYRIFERIVDQNNLTAQLTAHQGLRLDVICNSIFPQGVGVGPEATREGNVQIPASLIYNVRSEDEIAFTIAHEIAHVLLGHGEISTEYSVGNRDPEILELYDHSENAADKLGAILVANANYDPYVARDLFWHLTVYYEAPLLAWSPVIFDSIGTDDKHGTIGERFERIRQTLSEIEYVRLVSPTRSAELANAKSEYLELRRKELKSRR